MKRIGITYLLRPHWKSLLIAFIAVLGEAVTDLLEPWPLKIVFDNIIGNKKMSPWLATTVHSTIGAGKLSLLTFIALAVLAIALFGALSSYMEKYLTTSVAQWVAHDLRRVLDHHIQRLSLSYHDKKRTGDLISRITSDIDSVQDFVSQADIFFLPFKFSR